MKWKHFPRYRPFVWEIHKSPVNSPHKGQWRGALMFSLIWINGWANNRDAGGLRYHRANYDVIVLYHISSIVVQRINDIIPALVAMIRGLYLLWCVMESHLSSYADYCQKTLIYFNQNILSITITSHWHHDVSNHRQLHFKKGQQIERVSGTHYSIRRYHRQIPQSRSREKEGLRVNQNQNSFFQQMYTEYSWWYDEPHPCKTMTRVQLQNNDEGHWDYFYIFLHAMYSSRLFRAPISCATGNPTAQFRGVTRAASSGAYVDRVAPQFERQLGTAAVAMPVQSQSDWNKSKTRIPRPRYPTKSCGRTTARLEKEGPGVLRVKMSTKANLLLAQSPPPKRRHHHQIAICPFPPETLLPMHLRFHSDASF